MKRTFSILLLFSFVLPILMPGVALAQGQDTCEIAIVHYKRNGIDYEGWGLHIWGPTAVDGVTWTEPFQPTGSDDYGIFWEVPTQQGTRYTGGTAYAKVKVEEGQTMKVILTR